MPGEVIVDDSGLCGYVPCYTCDVNRALLLSFGETTSTTTTTTLDIILIHVMLGTGIFDVPG